MVHCLLNWVGWAYMVLKHPSCPGYWEVRGVLNLQLAVVGPLDPWKVQVQVINKLRQWVHDLCSHMSKTEQKSLPCYEDESDIHMVNHYEDRNGVKRVWGSQNL